MAEHRNAPALVEQRTGRGCLVGRGTSQIAQFAEPRQCGMWRVTLPSGKVRVADLTGRPAWLLQLLADAGAAGLTARDLPAGLRVGGYVLRLRREGVPIKTENEAHAGPYPGHHARYRLAAYVERMEVSA
jgi:hypothetical protein